MDETLWRDALPAEMSNLILAELAGRKTRYRALNLARWIVAKGLWCRSRLGFNLTRGSHKNLAEGLKEDHFLKYLGFTQGTIRGAVQALREAKVLEVIEAPKQRVINWRGQNRTPALRYRFTARFYAILKVAKPAPAAKPSNPRKASFFSNPLASKRLNPNGLGEVFRGKMNAALPTPVANPGKALTGSLGAAIDGLRHALFTHHKPVPRSPERIPRVGDWDYSEEYRERDFNKRFPYVFMLTKETWPKLYNENFEVQKEILHWLLDHVGSQVDTHAFRTSRGDDFAYLEHKIGFLREADAISFRLRWSGPVE